MNPFVVLHHEAGPGLERTEPSHLDWMFQRGDSLRTFATAVIEHLGELPKLDLPIEVAARALADHRLTYLDYEGEISNDRGHVRRVIGGLYELQQQNEKEFVARVRWNIDGEERTVEARFYRNFSSDSRLSDNREGWRLRLAP